MTATLPPATAPAQAITPRAWRVLAVTSLGVFIVLLDTTIINIAFPAITAAFPSTTRAACRGCSTPTPSSSLPC